MDKEKRLSALRTLAKKQVQTIDQRNIAGISADGIAELIHELETQQIELEIQNEDLLRAQEELVVMRDKYSELYDFAPIGYLTTDKKGLIIQSNLAVEEMLEVPRSKLVNTLLTEFIIEEDQGVFYKYQLKVLETQQRHSCELRFRKKLGDYFWTCMDGICINKPDDERRLVRLVLRDITQQKLSEKELRSSETQFRSLAENSQDYIMRYDKQCRHLYQNAAAYKVSGFSEEEFVGKTHRELDFDGNLSELWENGIAKVFKTKEPTSKIFEWESADGKVFLDWRLFPEFNEDGEVETVLAVSRDITENKNMEIRLFQSQKMESLGILSGGIAHDFNNLLGVIHGNVELIGMSTQLDKKTRERLDSIMKAATRATKLTKQLLGFSRRQVTTIKAADINQVITDLDTMISRYLTPEIKVEYQLAFTLWASEIDLGDFEDALLNLVINARDAMRGAGHLIIETSNKSLDACFCSLIPDLTPGDYVYVAISDNGEGIAPEKITNIFDPFYTSKPQGMGTGLGLSMAYGFAQRSGGHICVYSELGIGSTFNLYLPRTTSVVQQVDYPQLENHCKVHQIYNRQIKRMSRQLDQGENCNVLCSFLQDWWIEHIQTLDHAYASYCQGKEALIEAAMQKIETNSPSETDQ